LPFFFLVYFPSLYSGFRVSITYTHSDMSILYFCLLFVLCPEPVAVYCMMSSRSWMKPHHACAAGLRNTTNISDLKKWDVCPCV
jgi:hypothetical protein